MSYEKSTVTPTSLPAALNLLLVRSNEVTADSRASLLASGTIVQLETGDLVWVANVVQDDPATINIEFFTCAIAIDAGGTPRYRANGMPVATQWWHSVDPPAIAALGVAEIRKTLMMQALGEDLPVETADVFRAHKAYTAQQRSIRSALTTAAELAAPLGDVL